MVFSLKKERNLLIGSTCFEHMIMNKWNEMYKMLVVQNTRPYIRLNK